jgi:hypothetical protein
MPGDQRRAAGDQRQGDEQARRCAVDDDEGARLISQFRGAEHEQHAPGEETEHGDLDTKGRRGLSRNQQQGCPSPAE